MLWRSNNSPDATLALLDEALAALRAPADLAAAVARVRADVAALRFHRSDRAAAPPVVLVVLGGTGTGKSTLVNRLAGASVTATSFRRTFTAGCVAVAEDPLQVPPGWLGLDRAPLAASELPAKGRPDVLLVAPRPPAASPLPVLVDTPDVDGDQPSHPPQADRAFRWATGVLFLVSPEKYQMTELLPYYRLAARYGVPAVFAMNKCESEAMRADYAATLAKQGWPGKPVVYAVARDDAGYEPPVDANLDALRAAAERVKPAAGEAREQGLSNRAADLLGRLGDQVVAPLRALRRDVDRTTAALRALEAQPPGVDVSPVTQQLRRRLQQRSVLYLIGPGKMIDRVRQVPGLLLRLPRYAWDWAAKGKISAGGGDGGPPADARDVPDFKQLLVEQLAIVQSRIDDVLRSTPAGERLVTGDAATDYAASKLPSSAAAAIADEELGELRDWLERRWNATPRDTAALMKLLKLLPGGERLTKWSEAAPYLLTVVVATHHAMFGHVDLVILGAYGLTAWLTERASNEVASRTRQANRQIQQRFERLAHEQIARTCAWLDGRAPDAAALDRLEELAEKLSE